MSGGGAVYHYPGNLNVSIFLRKRPGLSEVSSVFRFFGRLLSEALSGLIPTVRAEDNGLYVDGLKVGGAAQAHRGIAVLYHTTVLVRPSPVPMERLLLALRPGYRSEGIASRPRPMTSLAEHLSWPIEPRDAARLVLDALASGLSVHLEEGRLTAEEAAGAVALGKDKYGSPKWNRRL
jgi:lipoate-protein ligase A